eukprot:Gb_33602 [translate_table: standard]
MRDGNLYRLCVDMSEVALKVVVDVNDVSNGHHRLGHVGAQSLETLGGGRKENASPLRRLWCDNMRKQAPLVDLRLDSVRDGSSGSVNIDVGIHPPYDLQVEGSIG